MPCIRTDVAVYSPYAGSLYAGVAIGGAELQSTYLARALASRGRSVAHVVRVPGGAPPSTDLDGVRVVALGDRYDASGFARRRAILAGLLEADACLYVQRSASFETGMVGLFARAKRRRFVFSSSSVADFRLDAETTRVAGASLDDRKSRLQYQLGVKLAEALVVQTEEQRRLARDAFGRDALVIPSFCEPAPAGDGPRDAFLWVGGLAEVKDPLAYLALARRVPDARFRMLATARGSPSLAAAVERAAASLANFELLEPRPREEALELYDSALALVNTSHLEGFPNTFLEAWAHATPVLSLRVDPDGVIAARGLGAAVGGSLERLVDEAARLVHDRTAVRAAGEAARDYVRDVHAPETIGARWASLVDELLR